MECSTNEGTKGRELCREVKRQKGVGSAGCGLHIYEISIFALFSWSFYSHWNLLEMCNLSASKRTRWIFTRLAFSKTNDWCVIFFHERVWELFMKTSFFFNWIDIFPCHISAVNPWFHLYDELFFMLSDRFTYTEIRWWGTVHLQVKDPNALSSYLLTKIINVIWLINNCFSGSIMPIIFIYQFQQLLSLTAIKKSSFKTITLTIENLKGACDTHMKGMNEQTAGT